jgi:cytidylate kinase
MTAPRKSTVLISRQARDHVAMEHAIAMLGPPGSGKGTQAARLRERVGFAALATGDLLREARVAGTDLGRRASHAATSCPTT